MRRKKQKTPSLTGGAGSLNRVNLLGSVFTVNPVYNNLSRLGNSLESGVLVKTPCITIGFCALSPHKLWQTNRTLGCSSRSSLFGGDYA